jgi:hypothetical protein
VLISLISYAGGDSIALAVCRQNDQKVKIGELYGFSQE